MLDPKHLYWLSEIVDLGSFSRAAGKLHVTQPTLSRAVQVIEDHVGGRVLERERHGVRPTTIGERLVEAGRVIASSRLQAEDVVDLWRGGVDRELRIGVGPMLAASIMGGFFAEMLEAKPRYAVRVVSATASRLIERLNDGNLDVVIAPEQINLFQDDLIQRRLFDDELAVFAGPKNTLAQSGKPPKLDDLADQEWIAIGTLSGIFGSTKEIFEGIGVRGVSASISFTGDVIMAAEILQRTSALCVMPKRLAELSDVLAEASEIKFDFRLPRRDIVLWCRRTERDRPDIRDFHDRLSSYIIDRVVLRLEAEED